MKIPRIAESVGYIDDDLIESAANAGISVRRLPIRRLVYVAICAIIVIVTCLTVYAVSSGDWFIPKEGLPEPPSEEIPQFIEFTDPNGETYKLRFDEENNDGSGFSLYSYTDDHGNFYYYNSKGEFVKSWHNSDDHTIINKIKEGDDSQKITEEEAREIAEKYLLTCHGEDFFDKYKYVKTVSNDSTYDYTVKYNIFYGKDNFIRGQSASVRIRYDGIVNLHSITNSEKLEGLNFDILTDISKDDVEKFIEGILDEVAILKQENGENVKGYEKYDIVDIGLYMDGDGYCIGISAKVYAWWVNKHEYITYRESDWHSEVPRFNITFRYPLENK